MVLGVSAELRNMTASGVMLLQTAELTPIGFMNLTLEISAKINF